MIFRVEDWGGFSTDPEACLANQINTGQPEVVWEGANGIDQERTEKANAAETGHWREGELVRARLLTEESYLCVQGKDMMHTTRSHRSQMTDFYTTGYRALFWEEMSIVGGSHAQGWADRGA